MFLFFDALAQNNTQKKIQCVEKEYYIGITNTPLIWCVAVILLDEKAKHQNIHTFVCQTVAGLNTLSLSENHMGNQ